LHTLSRGGTCAERQQTALERAGNPGLRNFPLSEAVVHPRPHSTLSLTGPRNPPAALIVAKPIATLKTIKRFLFPAMG